MTIDVYVIKLDMKRRGLMPLERSVPPMGNIDQLVLCCCRAMAAQVFDLSLAYGFHCNVLFAL